jgi:hypothetical protein
VIYEDYPEMGEVPYSCVWTARAVIDPLNGDIQWFKPERLTSGRRDAFQLFAGAGTGVAFAIVWQEDPKGLVPGEGDGPGEGWSGANTNNKTDVWYSYITLSDFALVDENYPAGGFGDGDVVDTDPELAGRVKALVPMSLPVKVSDNDVCSAENMDPDGGSGEHDAAAASTTSTARARAPTATAARSRTSAPPIPRDPTRSAPTPSKRPTPRARSTTSA